MRYGSCDKSTHWWTFVCIFRTCHSSAVYAEGVIPCMFKNYYRSLVVDSLEWPSNSGVARQFCARGRTMKLAPLPGLFFHIIQMHWLRFYNLNFNEIKYFKADDCAIIRRPSSVNLNWLKISCTNLCLKSKETPIIQTLWGAKSCLTTGFV